MNAETGVLENLKNMVKLVSPDQLSKPKAQNHLSPVRELPAEFSMQLFYYLFLSLKRHQLGKI